MSLDAMKQALEALEKDSPWREETIGKLRAAIEQAEKQEPHTEWLVCPNCNHKSPYSPIKAKTNEEDAERVTKQTRAALAREKQEPVAWVCTCGANLYVDDAGRPCSKVAPPQRQPSGSFVAWSNTLCNPLAPAEKQNLSAWEDGYASGIKDQLQPLTEEEIDELARTMVKGERSVNWLARAIERAHGIGGEHE